MIFINSNRKGLKSVAAGARYDSKYYFVASIDGASNSSQGPKNFKHVTFCKQSYFISILTGGQTFRRTQNYFIKLKFSE